MHIETDLEITVQMEGFITCCRAFGIKEWQIVTKTGNVLAMLTNVRFITKANRVSADISYLTAWKLEIRFLIKSDSNQSAF